jgi:hypothetical protein
MVKTDTRDYEGVAIIVTTCAMFFLWSVVAVSYPLAGVLG